VLENWVGSELSASERKVPTIFAKESGITLNRDEIRFVKRNKGVIVSEDNHGFFSVIWYTNKKKMERDWRSVVRELEADESSF
jgi:hypothetical protein